MIGKFKTIEDCIFNLRNDGFTYYCIENGHEIYTNKNKLAKITIHIDNSASVKYN